MRWLLLASLLGLMTACATPPVSPEEQAAHFGPVPDAPTAEQLASTDIAANVVWIARPDGADYRLVWPQDAWFAEAEATVGLDCLVRADGTVACAADDDGWPQYNFEQAARFLSTRFRLAPQNRGGESIVGKRIKINISFRFAN